MNKKRIKITDGGYAIPLGNNYFLMRGRTHEQGGIGIGKNKKNSIEVENGEVVKVGQKDIKVLSDQPMLNGVSPANALLAGGNFNKIFKAQQSINGNYGGSYAENGSKREIIGGTPNESRVKYYKQDKKLTETINAIANEYGIDNELLFHRIAKEGLIDKLINYNNYSILRNDKNISSGIDYNNVEPFSVLGLDDSYDNYEKYKLNRNIPVIKTPSINEKGREVNSIVTRNITDAIELMAADLNYRKERLASNGIKPTNSLISASYNRGIKGALDMYKNNPDSINIEYGIPDIYSDIVDKNTNNKIKGVDNVIFNDAIDHILNISRINYLKFGDIPFNDNQGIKNTFDKYVKSNFKGFADEEINALEKEFYKTIQDERQRAKKSEEEDIKDRSNFIVENERTYIPIIDGNYKLKNGGQINMKLKNKNKIDITKEVMNRILPTSTGERKKFNNGGVWGASNWSLLGNIGLNLLSGLGQGIAGSISASKARKMYDGLKRVSTYVPVAREHINTRVDVEPQLTINKEAESKLIKSAQENTSNSKVAREQIRQAVASRIQADHTVIGDKLNREADLRNAEAQLQTQYTLQDNANFIKDLGEQNDFEMQRALGKTNATISEGQTWGSAIASMLQNSATSIMDYATMSNDLLKSDNPAAYNEYMKREFGMYLNPDGTLKDKWRTGTSDRAKRIQQMYNKYFG
jgi:hypothetical protein